MVPMLDVLSAQVLLGLALGTLPALMVGLMVHRLGLANPDPNARTPSGAVGSFLVTWFAFAAWMGGLAGAAPDLATFPWAPWGAGVCTFVGLAGSARADAASMEVLKLIEGRVTSSRAASMNVEDFARLTRAVRGGIRALTALALVVLWVDVLPLGEFSWAANKLFLLAVNLAAAALVVSLVLVAMDALEAPEAADARKAAVPLALLLAAVTLIGGIGITAGIVLLAVLWWERRRVLPMLRELWSGIQLHARFDDLRQREVRIDGQTATIHRIGPMTTIVTHPDGDRTWRNDELWKRVSEQIVAPPPAPFTPPPGPFTPPPGPLF